VFYVLSKTLDLVFTPILWAIVLIWLARARRRKSRRWAMWSAIELLYFLSIEPVANALERSLESSAHATMTDAS